HPHVRTPPALVAAWRLALALLERQRAAYRAKAVSLPELLPRNDAVVVYLGADDVAIATRLASTVSGVAGIGTAVSAFAERVGEGVASPGNPPTIGRTCAG